jgi:hypothetical protein
MGFEFPSILFLLFIVMTSLKMKFTVNEKVKIMQDVEVNPNIPVIHLTPRRTDWL